MTSQMTARDLAKRLGVSQSTISRAFSDHASIHPEMRARVIESARQVGYTPNVIARALSTRRSAMIGIVMGGFQNPFYAMLLDLLSQALQAAGFQTLLFNVAPGEELDSKLTLLGQYHVDAVVIASATISSQMARRWTDAGRRAVLFNRLVPDTEVPSVICDNEAGAAEIAAHFRSQGRRRLAFIAGPGNTATSIARERGFSQYLHQHGHPPVATVRAEEYSYEAGFQAARALADKQPDAVFCANDILAFGAIDALRRAPGHQTRRNVAIAGFDDIPMAAWPGYALTTIRQPLSAMVAATIDILQKGLAGEQLSAEPLALRGALVIRASSTEIPP